MLSICLGVAFLVRPVSSAEIIFPDPALEAAVRKALDIPSGPITSNQLASLTSLDLNQIGVFNLAGLEHATALQTLMVIAPGLTNASPISALTNLTSLQLLVGYLPDISFLSNNWRIQGLQLAGNQIESIAPLARLTNISYLTLNGNPVTNIHVLSNLTSLSTLYAAGVPAGSAEFARHLSQLTFVEMQDCGITDVSPFLQKPWMYNLALDRNPLTNAPLVGQLTGLIALSLGELSPPLTNLSFCAGLTNLENLFVDGNALANLEPILPLTNMFFLSAAHNQLTSLEGLQAFRGLHLLGVNGNAIHDLSPLSSLIHLESLLCDDNPLTNFAFSNAPLRYLTLRHTGIQDLSFVAQFSALETLVISSNHITDLAPLSGLTNLNQLIASWNQISNITVLTNLPLQYTTDISYNRVDFGFYPNALALSVLWSRVGSVYYEGQFIAPVIQRLIPFDSSNGGRPTLRFTAPYDPALILELQISTNLVDWTAQPATHGFDGFGRTLRLNQSLPLQTSPHYFRIKLLPVP